PRRPPSEPRLEARSVQIPKRRGARREGASAWSSRSFLDRAILVIIAQHRLSAIGDLSAEVAHAWRMRRFGNHLPGLLSAEGWKRSLPVRLSEPLDALEADGAFQSLGAASRINARISVLK